MQLRRIGLVLLGLLGAACDNPPGEIRVVNEYTGVCPLYFKTSEYRGFDFAYATTPLPAGETLLPPLRPGLIRVDLRTEGIACGPEPCTLGSAGFDSSCGFFTGARLPAVMVVRNSPGACNQPMIVCPDLASAAPDAATVIGTDAGVSTAKGKWVVSQAVPASGNGTIGITGVVGIVAPGDDKSLFRISATGLLGTTKHVLKADILVATGEVSAVSLAWTPSDGGDAGLALCATTPPWPPCAGVTYSAARKTITLVGTQLGNPVPTNGSAILDAELTYP
jgi:hypothetical protein